MSQLPGLIIGAALTLVATLVVQTLVIPWVQARTRKRERWEADVIDLLNLLEEQLQRAVRLLHREADTERVYRSVQDEPGYNQQMVREELRRVDAARRAADDELTQQVEHMRSLVARLQGVHRTAPHWLQVERQTDMLRVHITHASILALGADSVTDDEEWNEAWRSIDGARKRLIEQIEPLAGRMKPPRRRVDRRLRARLRVAAHRHTPHEHDHATGHTVVTHEPVRTDISRDEP